jgi:hypothetical protein
VSLVVIVRSGGDNARAAVKVAVASEPADGSVYPAPPPSSVTFVPTTSVPATSVPAPPLAPPGLAAPAYPVLTTAPRLVSMTADAAGGTITLTFDQAVEEGTTPYAGVNAGMNIIFYMNSSCATPSANGHAFRSGVGTPTVVVESSYRWPGTAYVTINAGVVTGVGNKLGNDPVGCTAVDTGGPAKARAVGAAVDTAAGPGGGAVTVLFDRPVNNGDATALAVFDDPACQHRVGGGTTFAGFAGTGQAAGLGPLNGGSVVVAATGLSAGPVYVLAGPGVGLEAYSGSLTPASACLAATPYNPPALLSATGDLGKGQVILKFSRPVIGGGETIVAMRLVVHMGDATCTHPNGNAHLYLAGVGTDTITVDATSLVAGTTYISIAPGFVRSADDGTANRAVACYPLPVS